MSNSYGRHYATALVNLNRLAPRNLGIDLAIFLLPLIYSAPTRLTDTHTAYAILTFLLARGGGLALDDYIDRDADTLKNRPITRGHIPAKTTLILGITLLTAGLFVSTYVHTTFTLIVAGSYAALAISFLLSRHWVSTIATVSAVSTLSLMGWFVYGPLAIAAILLYAATWFWDLSHDIIGDLRDTEQDRRAGFTTLAHVLGPRTGVHIATGAIILSYFALTTLHRNLALLLLTLPLLLYAYLAVRLRRSWSGKRRALENYLISISAVIGIYVFALGGAV